MLTNVVNIINRFLRLVFRSYTATSTNNRANEGNRNRCFLFQDALNCLQVEQRFQILEAYLLSTGSVLFKCWNFTSFQLVLSFSNAGTVLQICSITRRWVWRPRCGGQDPSSQLRTSQQKAVPGYLLGHANSGGCVQGLRDLIQ
jgi:hypothetical protein